MANSFLDRAFAAHYRGSSTGLTAEYPSMQHSSEETLNGLRYVVLRSTSGTPLSVYRISQRDTLRRLRRWPAAFQAGEERP